MALPGSRIAGNRGNQRGQAQPLHAIPSNIFGAVRSGLDSMRPSHAVHRLTCRQFFSRKQPKTAALLCLPIHFAFSLVGPTCYRTANVCGGVQGGRWVRY